MYSTNRLGNRIFMKLINKRLLKFMGVIFASFFIFSVGLIVGISKVFPYTMAVDLGRSVQKSFTLFKLGDDGYIKSQLLAQSTSPFSRQSNLSSTSRELETSELPLKLAAISLAKNTNFPSGGGNITSIDGEIVIMDRLGGIYLYADAGLKKIDLGIFPSNLEQFIIKSKYKLHLDSLRAHSIAYDKVNKKIYVSFDKYKNNHTVSFTVASIEINPKTFERIGDWKTVFEANELDDSTLGIAGGGKLFISGDILYFAIGDFGIYATDDKSQHPQQDINSPFGKIYEYNLQTDKIKVKSIGHRNTQGIALSQDRKLLNVEQGPQGGDEINIIEDGRNYGWPVATYGTDYGAFDWSYKTKYNKKNSAVGSSRSSEFTEPLFSFVPSIGISSIHLISNFNEKWNGDMLVGSLKAQSLYRIKIVEDRVVLIEPIWIGSRIRDINYSHGKLVVFTDDSQLIFIEVDKQKLILNSKYAGYFFEPSLNACLKCHHFGSTNPANLAPSLTGIFNRKIASDSFSHYSPSLSKLNGHWDKDSLRKFIKNPSAFAPGSSMPPLGLSEQDLDTIVDVLSKAN